MEFPDDRRAGRTRARTGIVDPLEPYRKDAEGAEHPEFHPIFTNNVVIQVR